jgi:hypothetical protein
MPRARPRTAEHHEGGALKCGEIEPAIDTDHQLTVQHHPIVELLLQRGHEVTPVSRTPRSVS